MSSQLVTFPFLLMLAGCSVPPQSPQKAIMSPVVVVESTPLKLETQIKVPAIKPLPNHVVIPAKSTADTRCPPNEGETEQQRIIRKLDCLLERN